MFGLWKVGGWESKGGRGLRTNSLGDKYLRGRLGSLCGTPLLGHDGLSGPWANLGVGGNTASSVREKVVGGPRDENKGVQGG